MTTQRRLNTICGAGTALTMLFSLAAVAQAPQQGSVEGMILGRDGATMYVRTSDSPRQIVVLSDGTKATEKGGFLGWSHKDLGVAALVPGLHVKIDGSYDGDHQLVARKVEFSRTSMTTARQIDAGLTPVNEKMAKQQDQLMTDRRDIEATQQDIADAKTKIDTNTQAIASTQQDLGQTNGRIGALDQYDTKDTLTVSFRNGSSVVKKEDKDKLEDFVKQAANTPGAMIEVQGYASKVGNASLNQKLSSERADNVLTIIQQSGAVPMTRILAPAAMGVTEQVADNHSRSGQAQNRRVVVTIVVNKGITGAGQQASMTPDQQSQQIATTPQQ
ncbi:Outer membrane protein OmpA [Bryocella elongata]|uniref:Outer membrane protein OmpA n=1 Tax=Bryocella elongata TaxID=863522 RepID=A0A1H6B3P9_9BACT|nr:OmpA family protein [Bryocella elongata]SEG55458.1 Outer membrane protein OmpA [Bryocella elongata]